MDRPPVPRTPYVEPVRRPPLDRRPVANPAAGPSIATTISQPIARAMQRLRREPATDGPTRRAEGKVETAPDLARPSASRAAMQPTLGDLYTVIDALVEQNQILSGLIRTSIEQSQAAMSFMQRAMGMEIDVVEAAVMGPGEDDDEGDGAEPPAEIPDERPTEPDVKVPDEDEPAVET